MLDNHYLKLRSNKFRLNSMYDSFIYNLLPDNYLFTLEEAVRLAKIYADWKPTEVNGLNLSNRKIQESLESLEKACLVKSLNGSRLERLVKNLEYTTSIA